jgi:hypothetical protein
LTKSYILQEEINVPRKEKANEKKKKWRMSGLRPNDLVIANGEKISSRFATLRETRHWPLLSFPCGKIRYD